MELSVLNRSNQTGLTVNSAPPRPPLHLPAGQQLGHVGPAVSQESVGLTDDAVFLQSPAALLHHGIEVVVPSLAALLPVPTVQVLGDERPALHAVFMDQFYHLPRK